MSIFSKSAPKASAPTRAPSADEPYPGADLSPAQQRALDDLRMRGIAVMPFAELIDDDELWRELEADMADYVERAKRLAPKLLPRLTRPRNKDQFLVRRWGGMVNDPPVASDGPWIRYAASDALLNVVNTYRGVYTKLVGLDNVYTVPFKHSSTRVASQAWHRDPEDAHVVKCFLYFSNVDDDSGPFEYIPGSAPGGPYGDLWPWGTTWPGPDGREQRWYPPEGELEAKVPEQDRWRLTGAPGTLILCETSGFHRGGFSKSKPRAMSVQTYISPSAEWKSVSFELDRRGEEGLSQQARYAIAT